MNSVVFAIEPVPVQFGAFGWVGTRAPIGGGALMYVEIDGVDLRRLAWAAGAEDDLGSPVINDERYFDYLGGAPPQGCWRPLERNDRLMLLSRGPDSLGEITYACRITLVGDSVVWDRVEQYPPAPPEPATSSQGERAPIGPFRFARDSYGRAVTAAAALFRVVALDARRVAHDEDHRQLNDAVRRLRIVEGLAMAARRRDALSDIDPDFPNDRARWSAIRRVAMILDLAFEPAEAVLDAYVTGKDNLPDNDGLAAEREQLISEIGLRAGTTGSQDLARLEIERRSPPTEA